MSNTTITKTVFFKAPPETVWAFLTEKEKLATWFHPADNDLVEGNDYALMETSESGIPERVCWGTVLKMIPPKTLEYTFTVKPMNGLMTTVFWTLEEVQGGTKLSMSHKGVGENGEATLGLLNALDAGWDEHFKALRTAVRT